MANLQLEFVDAIAEIAECDWNRAAACDYPFTRFEFLHALEASGAVAPDRGWQAHHLIIRRQDQLVGVMPLYIKTHSYGEYVFVIRQEKCLYGF